jgi:hypothetical protein
LLAGALNEIGTALGKKLFSDGFGVIANYSDEKK